MLNEIYSCVQYAASNENRGVGTIRTLRPLNREERTTLLVPLVITDSGNPKCSSTATFTIHVADQNDNPMTTAIKNVYVNVVMVSIIRVTRQ